MFTGIIEEIGIVKNIQKKDNSSILTIGASKVLEDTHIGDSIATNGVCLTVTTINNKESFNADIMAESLRRSNLGELKLGDLVNLERALSLNTRLGGHIVSGHIDGIGVISNLKQEGNAIWATINTDNSILRYIVEKGSIAIDGISLTVAYVDEKVFKVSIIPHTGDETILLKKRIRDTVNLECDIVGKYIEKFTQKTVTSKNNISEDFLKTNGFI